MKEVERKARKITVYSLELISFDEETQSGSMRVACSKGTYIRTLLDDIAKKFCKRKGFTARFIACRKASTTPSKKENFYSTPCKEKRILQCAGSKIVV